MSKSHRRRRKNAGEVKLASLSRRFVQDYGQAYARLAAQLREQHPEITKRGRRTGRALRDIGFFVWSSCRNSDRKRIPSLFRAAVLLAAQDDYYDNLRIPTAQKELFGSTINEALRGGSFPGVFERNAQLRDLVSLWSYVSRTIPRTAPRVRSYWIETACRLNDAMAAENRAARRATITYEEYMRTAIQSIGMTFFWATYLANERVPMTTVRDMAPLLLQGARVVRLSNDLASYRHRRNRASAVTLVGGRNPEGRILRLVARESRAFRRGVEALDVKPHVRDVLLHSMEFLREFYMRSDFGRGPG